MPRRPRCNLNKPSRGADGGHTTWQGPVGCRADTFFTAGRSFLDKTKLPGPAVPLPVRDAAEESSYILGLRRPVFHAITDSFGIVEGEGTLASLMHLSHELIDKERIALCPHLQLTPLAVQPAAAGCLERRLRALVVGEVDKERVAVLDSADLSARVQCAKHGKDTFDVRRLGELRRARHKDAEGEDVEALLGHDRGAARRRRGPLVVHPRLQCAARLLRFPTALVVGIEYKLAGALGVLVGC
mmetsp:Transcript_55258/g.89543  ORF Transcript_55258/g.89543 Transcript_55258/m.89543 type:complete len:243 (-) Transcript_55258:332-1060(-)